MHCAWFPNFAPLAHAFMPSLDIAHSQWNCHHDTELEFRFRFLSTSFLINLYEIDTLYLRTNSWPRSWRPVQSMQSEWRSGNGIRCKFILLPIFLTKSTLQILLQCISLGIANFVICFVLVLVSFFSWRTILLHTHNSILHSNSVRHCHIWNSIRDVLR